MRSVEPEFFTAAETQAAEAIDREMKIGSRAGTKLPVAIEWITALTISLIIIFFHFLRIRYAGPLWRDEISTVTVAEQHSISSFYSFIGLDSFPGMIHVIVAAWRYLPGGGTIFGLRIFGAMIGLATLAGLWAISLLLSRRPPLLTLAIYALNPVVLQWGDSLRAYGFGSLLLMMAIGLTAEAIGAKRAPRRILLLMTVATFLSVQTLYSSGLLLTAIAGSASLIAIANRRWRLFAWLAASLAAAAAGTLIYTPLIISLGRIHQLQELSPGAMDNWARFKDALDVSGPLTGLLWGCMLALGLITTATVLFGRDELCELNKYRQRTTLFCVLVITSSIPAFDIYLRILNFYANVWYFIPIFAVLAFCCDLIRTQCVLRTGRPEDGVSTRGSHLRIALWMLSLVLTICCAAVSVVPTWKKLHERQTNLDEVASFVGKSVQDGDVILVAPEYLKPPFCRYFTGSNQVLTLPPQPNPYMGLRRVKEAMAMASPNVTTDEAMAHALIFGHRVWLINTIQATPLGQPPPFVPVAPHPIYGWSQYPYLSAWEMQTADLLRSHAERIKTFDVPQIGLVNDKEDVRTVLLISGWRD